MTIHPMRKSLPLPLWLRSVSAKKTLRKGGLEEAKKARRSRFEMPQKRSLNQAHSYNRLI